MCTRSARQCVLGALARCINLGSVRADASFSKLATVNQAAFFKALAAAGHPDLADSPFAASIFAGVCEESDPKCGATRVALQHVVWQVTAFRILFRVHARGQAINKATMPQIMSKLVGEQSDEAVAAELQSAFTEGAYAEEVFLRYDTDEDGLISESEWCAMCLVLQQAQRSLPQTAAPPLLPPTPCFGVVVAGA